MKSSTSLFGGLRLYHHHDPVIAPIVDTHHHALRAALPFLGLLAAGPKTRSPWFSTPFRALGAALVAYKFLLPERLSFWSAAPTSLIYSVPSP